ncbi:MAG: Ada metal-binding domain-containing protein [Bacillota bacterium]
MNFGLILIFREGDYIRKQISQQLRNAIGEFNLIDERWWAIVQNDASYNDKFYYVVKTKIFCLPPYMPSTPNRESVRVFLTPTEAIQENFRPCKKCKNLCKK